MTSIALFDSIEDDGLVKELLSFCDFQSLNSMRQTCQRLMNLSDETMDYMVVSTIDNLHIECECWTRNLWSMTILKGTLKRGWTTEYRSKISLINAAVEDCAKGNLDELEFDEDRAKHLLQTRGFVESEDFHGDENGGDGNLELSVMYLSGINRLFAASFAKDWIDAFSDEGEHSFKLKHSALCFIRKADPGSINYFQKVFEYRHNDGIQQGNRITTIGILMKIPSGSNEGDSEEIEFHFIRNQHVTYPTRP